MAAAGDAAEGGGHLGFHGDDSRRPWCDLALEKFLACAIDNMEA